MNMNVNLDAAVGVLMLLGSCVVMFVIALVAVHALLTKRPRRARFAIVAAFGWMMVYLSVLMVFSLSSRERALARGEEKRFCEIDCHLAYSVADVQRMKTLGPAERPLTARGIFYLVTIRTRFDEKTVSPSRGQKPLKPNSRVVTITDAGGTAYAPSPEGQRALELARSSGTPIETPLRPGESYTTAFIFDLPENIMNPLLLINEGGLVTRFVIGHENSPLHKKVLFRLDDAAQIVSGAYRRSRP